MQLLVFLQVVRKISDDIDAAEANNKQAADLVKQRQAELAGSKEEAANIIQVANDTASQNRAKVLATANEEATSLKNVRKKISSKNAKKLLTQLKAMLRTSQFKLLKSLLDNH